MISSLTLLNESYFQNAQVLELDSKNDVLRVTKQG
jgi:hypothetical protein